MSSPRMIQRQFGSVRYDTGTMLPGQTVPLSATLQFEPGNAAYGVWRHNDQIYGAGIYGNVHFATFDYVDLRDLIDNKECMDDVTINVQRLKELPYPDFTYNLGPGNIEETLVVILGDLNLDDATVALTSSWHKFGFQGIKDDPGTGENFGGLPFEVLYRENRQYVQDPSQNFLSPDQMGSQAGATGNPAEAPTRVVGNFRINSRTIGGYPDLIVGPGITIMRIFSVFPAVRTAQTITGGGPQDAPADEFTFLQARLQPVFPALQINIVGTQRKLTSTETATYYSNIINNRSTV